MSTNAEGKRQVLTPGPAPIKQAPFKQKPVLGKPQPAAPRTPATPSTTAPAQAAPTAPAVPPTTASAPTPAKPAARKRTTVKRDKVQVSVWVPDHVMDQVSQLKSYLGMDSAHVVIRALSESPDKLREAIQLERRSRLPEGVPEPTASPFSVDEPARMSRRVVKGGRAQLGFYLAPANLEVLDQLVETVGANARPELLTASISALYRACNLN